MATGKRYYWLKLKESFFDSTEIHYLMNRPDGAQLVMLYLCLCRLTMNTDGVLGKQTGKIFIPYDEKWILRTTGWFDGETVRTGLTLFQALGLMEQKEDRTFCIPQMEDMVGSETEYAARNRKQRAKEKDEEHNVLSNVSPDVSQSVYTEKETKKDTKKDIYIEREKEPEKEKIPGKTESDLETERQLMEVFRQRQADYLQARGERP